MLLLLDQVVSSYHGASNFQFCILLFSIEKLLVPFRLFELIYSASSAGIISMDVIEAGQSNRRQLDDLKDGTNDKHTNSMRGEIHEKKLKNSSRWKAASSELLNHVKLKRSPETPRSTIKGFFDISNQTEPKFSMKNLKKAEKQLKLAFNEYYYKLQLLKNYR
jgi:hypothetical protein